MFCWREPAYFHELCLLAGAAAGVRGACLQGLQLESEVLACSVHSGFSG